MPKIYRLSALLGFVAILVACGTSGYLEGPLYELYMMDQPIQNSNEGRLFFYTTDAWRPVEIRVDGRGIGKFPQPYSFFYADVSKGKHKITMAVGNHIDRVNELEISVSGGDIHFFEQIGVIQVKTKNARLLNIYKQEGKSAIQRCTYINPIVPTDRKPIVKGKAKFAGIEHSLPDLEKGYARIYFYCQEESALPLLKFKPPVTIDGETVGVRIPGSFFFADVLPGTHKIGHKAVGFPVGWSKNIEEESKTIITTTANDSIYIEMFLRSIKGVQGRHYHIMMRPLNSEQGKANIRYLKYDDTK